MWDSLTPSLDRNNYYLLLAIVTSLTFIVYHVRRSQRRGSYPPGPPGLPIIGNLHQFPNDTWIAFTKWGKEYGPVVYLNVLGADIVLFNSLKAAVDVLDRQGSKCASRPHNIVVNEMLSGDMFFGFLPDNERWKKMRRAAHEGLSKNASKGYYTHRYREARILVDSLLAGTSNWDTHLKKFGASLMLTVCYDEPPLQSLHDPAITKVHAFVDRMIFAAYPGNFLVEYFTFMKYFPRSIAKWKREALDWFKHDNAMFGGLYRKAIKKSQDEGLTSNIAIIVSKESARIGLDEVETSWVLAAAFAAGSDTTAAALGFFILAMVSFPEVQKRAQEELDEIVGRDRMPNEGDLERLPYIQAIVKEILRWRPPGPIGSPHLSTDDIVYEGHLIPKGSMCVSNMWGINRDPELYGEDVENFNPSRFLDKERISRLNADTRGESHIVYGFGKRICSGRNFANDTLMATISTLLWALTLEPKKDASGNPIKPPADDYEIVGLTIHPPHVDITVKNRFPEVSVILENSEE